MKRKAMFIFILAVVLALGLWGVEQIQQKYVLSAQEKQQLSHWNRQVPEFRGQTVGELYVVQPQKKSLHRLNDGSCSQEILDSLGQFTLRQTPTHETLLGFLLKMDGEFYPYYILPPTAEEEYAAYQALYQSVEERLDTAEELVDVFTLILPSQIQRLEFHGIDVSADGTEDPRELLLDTADPEVIQQLMSHFSRLEVESLRLQQEQEDSVDLSETLAKGGYRLILHLGQVYDHQVVQITGTRYGFTMDVEFQWQQRLYTVGYDYTRQLLDSILAQESASLRPFAGEAEEEESSRETPSSETAQRLPEEDRVQPPEALEILLP